MDWQVTADARTRRDLDLDVLAQVGEELAVSDASLAGNGQAVSVVLTVSDVEDPGAALAAGLDVVAGAFVSSAFVPTDSISRTVSTAASAPPPAASAKSSPSAPANGC